MNCPICPDTSLVMTDRSGIEIDYCPTCRGVWLDRGELDKIIERSTPVAASTGASGLDRNVRSTDRDRSDEPDWFDDDFDQRADDRKHDGRRPRRRRESLLGDLFDF